MNSAHAIVTTYSISISTSNGDDGTLTKLGSRSTEGFQAAHACFSPDGSTYVIAHHNGGKLVFFDATNPVALAEPVLIIDPPEVVPGTRKDPVPNTFEIGVPSLHGVSYAPNGGKYLLCVDPQQNAVFTYSVNKMGRPTTNTAISQVECKTEKEKVGVVFGLLSYFLKLGPRPRRAVVHPNGKYMYVVHEATNYIQVYAINEEGTVSPKLLQEISCRAPIGWWVGLAITNASELQATEDYLIVSVRGMSALGGRCESSVRFFSYKENGAMLENAGTLQGIPAAVRHFYLKDNVLWVGINSSKTPLVLKYVKKEGDLFELTGQANVGMDVFCVTPKEV
jgi:6-phosphogluconolactonase (cycloisomerase 2 family)